MKPIMRDILGEVEAAAPAALDPANSTDEISDAQCKLHRQLQEAHPVGGQSPERDCRERGQPYMEVTRTKEKRHLEEAVRYASRVSEEPTT